MSDKQEIAEGGKRAAVQFAWIIKLAEMVGEIGNIEQAEAEANNRLATAQASHQAVLDGYADAETAAASAVDQVNRAHTDAKAALRQTVVETTALIEAKDKEAAQIIDDAHAEADRITAKARSEANATISAAMANAAGFQPAIDAAQKKLDALTAQADAAAERLATITAQLAALRDRL